VSTGVHHHYLMVVGNHINTLDVQATRKGATPLLRCKPLTSSTQPIRTWRCYCLTPIGGCFSASAVKHAKPRRVTHRGPAADTSEVQRQEHSARTLLAAALLPQMRMHPHSTPLPMFHIRHVTMDESPADASTHSWA
jgi:hypothetical protein